MMRKVTINAAKAKIIARRDSPVVNHFPMDSTIPESAIDYSMVVLLFSKSGKTITNQVHYKVVYQSGQKKVALCPEDRI